MWLIPARPWGPTAPSALGRTWGAHLGQPHAGSSCFPALRAKALYTDKQFVPSTTSVSINKHSFTSMLSLQTALCECQYSKTQHILAEIRNQGSQVVQNISGPFHLGFAPPSCRCSGTMGASHSATTHTQGNLAKPSQQEAASCKEPRGLFPLAH